LNRLDILDLIQETQSLNRDAEMIDN